MRGFPAGIVHFPQMVEHHSVVFEKMGLLQRKHKETYRHCVRVALLGEKLAKALLLDSLSGSKLVRGCFIHDLGKLMVPNAVLDNKGALTDGQWKMIKLHPQLGADMLQGKSELDDEIVGLVLHHHERWDGKGYPNGLRGDDIPLLARACSVVDAFDSMLSHRPYRSRKTVEEAMSEVERNAGTQFDPRIVERFIPLSNEVKLMYGTGSANDHKK